MAYRLHRICVVCRVSLCNGVDIYAAASADWLEPLEDALSRRAERIDWRRVPPSHLHARDYALSYLDATGYRFYMPAIMTTMLCNEDSRGNYLSLSCFTSSEWRAVADIAVSTSAICSIAHSDRRSSLPKIPNSQLPPTIGGIDHDRTPHYTESF